MKNTFQTEQAEINDRLHICEKCGSHSDLPLHLMAEELYVCVPCHNKYGGQAVDYFTAPMFEGDMIVLAQLLVRYHNSITAENCSFYGAKMDKALCSDTFSTLFRKGPYEKLCEIRNHFVKEDK